MNKMRAFFVSGILCAFFLSAGRLYGQDIVLLYTGETHAMLYPCNCPKEPDGGIARRSTLVKELRKKNPNTLLLDSGDFFAGGLMDEYTLNTQLDKERTRVNIAAMLLMKYDALTLGDDEFNFGREFLEDSIGTRGLALLSCNISFGDKHAKEAVLYKPYLIKEVAGTKIGIIGVTAPFASQKSGSLSFTDPKISVKQAVQELKGQGVHLIVLLSHLGEQEDAKLLEAVGGIDVLVTGHNPTNKGPQGKIGSTIVVRPSWQGRSLGKLTLSVQGHRIIDYRAEELRLSDKVADDPQILAVRPRCFSDTNCKKEGLAGVCQDPGSLKASCIFTEAARVSLTIIAPKKCSFCNTEPIIKFLRTSFPGLEVASLYYPDPETRKLVNDFGIKGLPAYLLGKETEKERNFDTLKDKVEAKGDFYLLKPEFVGFSYLQGRKRIEGKLDVFISLFAPGAKGLLDSLKDFKPDVHFLAVAKDGGFEVSKGNLEIEEDLRSVCVQKYYPREFWGYISCRAQHTDSSWWEDCLPAASAAKVRECARSDEGKSLLGENVSLGKELKVMLGPAYLMDNQEIFSTNGTPSKAEFKKIFRK